MDFIVAPIEREVQSVPTIPLPIGKLGGWQALDDPPVTFPDGTCADAELSKETVNGGEAPHKGYSSGWVMNSA